ncbi:MAG: hypothetical protein QFX35_02415 [Candidatus Verstraetearchaeota archaeon]|nr:hypothetical protein [Candidatus Verstraetearchaeota archaeon]
MGFVLMVAATLSLGSYSAALGNSELLHFWIAVPAGNITSPIVVRGAGPPISMSPIVVDLQSRGVLKNLLQPQLEGLSTHWIYNIGKKPVKIRLSLTNLPPDITVDWDVNSGFGYDEATHTFTSMLNPGSSIPNLGIDWIFHIPAYYLDEPVIYRGGLEVIDADTNTVLTFIPIEFVNGAVSNDTSGGGSCH